MTKIRDQDIINAFGKKVKELREQKSLSVEALAAQANIEFRQLYRVENGEINPSLSTMYAIAKGLEIPFKDLTNLEGF